MTVRFDDSLPALVSLVRVEFGNSTLNRAIFVRDATGYLSVVVDEEIPEERIASLNEKAQATLGGYARTDDCIRDRNGLGAGRIIESKARKHVKIFDDRISLIDRRMVGADWLLPPKVSSKTPRIAFVSIKGGVGRSTALAVLAAHFSNRGLRVLVIDLDMEAPGIGSMLITEDAMPKFGTLDYLVENGISGIDDDFMDNISGKSFLGAGGGQVTVVPAFGTATMKHPAGGLDKISRAYLEDVGPKGNSITLTDQVREIIGRFESTGAYDLVLVDGRAGLHESTAAVVLGLGAEVLFFGVDEPQTFIGYKVLLAHISSYEGDEYREWAQRIQFVNAKAQADRQLQEEATKRFLDLMETFAPEASMAPATSLDDGPVTAEDFDLDWKSVSEDIVSEVIGNEIPVLNIIDDPRFRSFDPINKPQLLTADIFQTTYAELIQWADEIVLGDQP